MLGIEQVVDVEWVSGIKHGRMLGLDQVDFQAPIFLKLEIQPACFVLVSLHFPAVDVSDHSHQHLRFFPVVCLYLTILRHKVDESHFVVLAEILEGGRNDEFRS